MDLSSILVFIGLFITILSILIGIAYYGIGDKSYEDALKEKGVKLDDDVKSKKSKKESSSTSSSSSSALESKKLKQQQQKNQQINKKQKNENTETNESEEEQIVAVPDPFTNKVFTRFDTTNVKKDSRSSSATKQQVQQQPQSQRQTQTPSNNFNNSNGQQQLKEKPKAAVKPNQTKNDATDNNLNEFITQNPKKDFKLKQQQQQQANNVQQPKATNVKPINTNGLAKQAVNDVLLNDYHQATTVIVAPTLEEQHKKQIKSLEQKTQDLNRSLDDKEKLIQTLNHTNSKLKVEFDRLNTQLSDIDQLKRTNQVMQIEITKLSQRCITFENEKTHVESKFKSEIERLRSVELSLLQKLQAKENEFENSKKNISNTSNSQEFVQELNNVKNELTEVRKQLDTLKEEQKIERKQHLVDLDVKEKQIQELNKSHEQKLKQLNDNLTKINQQLDFKETSIHDLNNELGKLNTQIDSFKEKQAKKDDSIPLTQHNDAISQKENSIKDLQAQIELLKQKQSETIQLKQHNDLITQKENLIKDLHAQIESLKQNQGETIQLKLHNDLLSQKENELNKIKNEQLESTQKNLVQEFETKITDLNKQLNEKDEKLNEYIKVSSLKDDDLRRLEENINNFKQTTNDLSVKNKSLNDLIEELKSKNETNNKNNETNTQFEQEFKILKVNFENEKNKNIELESNYKALNDKFAGLKTIYEVCLRSQQTEKQENDKKVHILNEELKTIKDELTKQSNKTNEITSKNKSLMELVEDLKVKNVSAQQTKTEDNNNNEEIEKLRQELKLQKDKNNELREKNWKVMDALKDAEKKLVNQTQTNESNNNKTKKNDQSDKIEKSLKELNEENEKLKFANFQLRSILDTTEKNILNLESTVKVRENNLLAEIETNKTLASKLEKEKQSLEKKLNQENENLKKLLEEEKYINKLAVEERLRIQSIIKYGQNALDEEKHFVLKLEEHLQDNPKLTKSSITNGVSEIEQKQ